MRLSHPSPTLATKAELSGPAALRAHFRTRQRLLLREAAEIVNLSYSRFFRRDREGTLGLRIRTDAIGERYVLLDDLILYIFPPTDQPDTHSLHPFQKRGPGRPRKVISGREVGTK